jgi:hypothetical protein
MLYMLTPGRISSIQEAVIGPSFAQNRIVSYVALTKPFTRPIVWSFERKTGRHGVL